MTKSTSIVFISIIIAIALFFGVFAFLPVQFAYGEYGEFSPAFSLAQKANGFTESVKATYQVELEEGYDAAHVKSVIKTRLEKAFGYYSVSVEVNDNSATVIIPKTNNNDKASETSILTGIVQKGNVEVLTSSDAYSKANVVLGLEHFSSTKVRSYVQGEETYYICEVKLNAEGKKAAEKLTNQSQYYVAIDEAITYACFYVNNSVQIYCQNTDSCNNIAGFIKSGVIGAELTLDETVPVQSKGGLIFGLIFAAVVVASFIVFAVMFKQLGLAAILSQTIVTVIFGYFAGLVHLEMFNVFAAIGVVLGYGFMTFMSAYTLRKINNFAEEKTFASAKYNGFLQCNKLSYIAHGALLVLGVILWLIPTAVTAPLGNVLVYAAVLSFAATMGLNRVFVGLVSPLVEGAKAQVRK